jgi:hypothetical protein
MAKKSTRISAKRSKSNSYSIKLTAAQKKAVIECLQTSGRLNLQLIPSGRTKVDMTKALRAMTVKD